jgi:uncharacterized protein (DUF433 family)
MNCKLFGIGLYTPAEAARLTGIPAGKLSRWLKGHESKGRHYEPLWQPQVNIGDDRVYLGFRDLMEARTVAAFLVCGLTPQFIRRAIIMARELIDTSHPLSTLRFKTDGRSIFLEVAKEKAAEGTSLIDVVRRQYAFSQIIERSLKDVDFEGIAPARWFPASRRGGIVVDPQRSFGQPIDDKTGVPTAVLAAAAQAEGSIEKAARAWAVDPATIKRAITFENRLPHEARLKHAA